MTYDADDEYKRLSATHEKNQDARERFMPAAHTAILAASIAFVGQIAKPGTGIQMWMIVIVWLSSGLALCIAVASFQASARYITIMIKHVDIPPAERDKIPEIYIHRRLHEILSATPIWLLIPSIVMIIAFATLNVWR